MAVTDVKEGKPAVIFGYYVQDPREYGVIEFDENYSVLSLEEKPARPRSNYAAVGLYMYSNSVVKRAEKIRPSARGELEITDLNNRYLENNELYLKTLGRGYAWFDTGTYDSLYEATSFVRSVERRQGLMIGCLEEIAYYMKFINKEQLILATEPLKDNDYKSYLLAKIGRE